MSRTDRLMRLMDALRRLPAPVTAARLAGETGVSARQLYRDIATLRAGGALIDGEAGVGYSLTEDPALPPQSFSGWRSRRWCWRSRPCAASAMPS